MFLYLLPSYSNLVIKFTLAAHNVSSLGTTVDAFGLSLDPKICVNQERIRKGYNGERRTET